MLLRRPPPLTENGWEWAKWAFLIVFIIITFVFVLIVTRWEVSSAQHVWCQVIRTLNEPHAPPGNPATNPSRAYDQQLALEFRQLQSQLGC